MQKGLTFSEAILKATVHEKIIYGTRSQKWHVINEADRDFNTRYAISKRDAVKLGEAACAQQSLSATLF